jgi:hypothetical protein
MIRPKYVINSLYPYLPRPAQQALLVRMRAQLWIEKGIVFVHIPKAAGTSINELLYGRFMGHPRARDIQRWGTQELRSLPRFTVTRNPWDRLLSAYRFAKRGAGGNAIAAVWNPQQYQVPEFETFERFVLEWLARRDVRALDFVFQPQLPFIADGAGRIIVDHVGKLEDLEPTYRFLEEILGKPLEFPWENRSGDRVDYRELYTPEMADLVGHIYQDDVRAFGYEF